MIEVSGAAGRTTAAGDTDDRVHVEETLPIPDLSSGCRRNIKIKNMRKHYVSESNQTYELSRRQNKLEGKLYTKL